MSTIEQRQTCRNDKPGGARHRRKGSRIERQLVERHRALAVHAERYPLRRGRSLGLFSTQRDGLVAKLGQDRVQEIMAAAFAAVRDDLPKFEDIEAEPTFADDAWPAPDWREAALEYHKYRGDRVSIVPYAPENLARLRRLMDDNVSLDRAWHELNGVRNRPTPKATIDTVWWAICEHGMSALAEPRIADRIANFDEAARSELDRRIANIGVKK